MMICEQCNTRYESIKDPYGTGDYWYVLYEPRCNCEETKQTQEDEDE